MLDYMIMDMVSGLTSDTGNVLGKEILILIAT